MREERAGGGGNAFYGHNNTLANGLHKDHLDAIVNMVKDSQKQ